MNLSDGTIIKRLPEIFPTEGHPGNFSMSIIDQVQPATVDLRLGRTFWVLRLGMREERINPRTMSGKDYMSKVVIEDDRPFIMRPGPENFVLAETMEWIEVPTDLQAEVDGRSSFGRHGLHIHATAGVVDAGYKGVITLELSLSNRFELELYPGDRICQVKFQLLDAPAQRPYGDPSRRSKYQNQSGATPSRSNQDEEEAT